MTTKEALEYYLNLFEDEDQRFGPSQVLIEEIDHTDDRSEMTNDKTAFERVLCKMGPAWIHFVYVAGSSQKSKGVISTMVTLEESVLEESVFTGTDVADQTCQDLTERLKQFLPEKEFREIEGEIELGLDTAVRILQKEDSEIAGGYYVRAGSEEFLVRALEKNYVVKVVDGGVTIGQLSLLPKNRKFEIVYF